MGSKPAASQTATESKPVKTGQTLIWCCDFCRRSLGDPFEYYRSSRCHECIGENGARFGYRTTPNESFLSGRAQKRGKRRALGLGGKMARKERERERRRKREFTSIIQGHLWELLEGGRWTNEKMTPIFGGWARAYENLTNGQVRACQVSLRGWWWIEN